MNQFKPFQLEGIEHILERKYTLLGDEQGLGKTIQAIGVINAWRWTDLRAKILIVCPSGLRRNWFNELSEWLERDAKIFTVASTKDIVPDDFDILICSYMLATFDGISTQLKKFKYYGAIFDEVHYLQNSSAKTTKFFLGHLRKNYERAVDLSGTPIRNSGINIYPVLRSHAPEIIDPYLTKLDFGKKFCGAYCDERFGWIYKGNTCSPELHQRLKESGFMLRRLKKDVLPDLPPRILQLIPFESNVCTPDIFERQKAVEWDVLKSKVNLGEDVNAPMYASMRKDTANCMLDASCEFIEDLLTNHDKLVVFAYHRHICKAIRDRFVKTAKYTFMHPQLVMGGLNDTKKQKAIDTFQNDPKSRIFVGQIQAGGVGITLTKAHVIVFVESSWCPADILQAIDRCHRIGQDEPVVVYFLVVQGTISEVVLSTAIKKLKSIQGIIDGKFNGKRNSQ